MRSSISLLVRKTTLLLCIVLIFGMASSWNATAIGNITGGLFGGSNKPEKTPEPETTPGPTSYWIKNEYTNGDVYEGNYNPETGKYEGSGTYRWADGDFYEGMWKDGKAFGYGVYHWADGRLYEGMWENGKKAGFGIIRDPGGDSYEGMFKDNLFSGFGVYRWADGDSYEGMFKEDDKSGFGIYLGGADTNYYISVGEWQEDVHNGNVRIHWRDHSIKWGLCENNIFADEMTKTEEQYEDWNGFRENLALDDGSFYTGEYNTNGGDFVEGYGIMTYPDGSMYIGKFKEGFEKDTSASGIFVSPDHAATEYKGPPDEYARIMPKPNP